MTKIKPLGKDKGWHIVKRHDRDDGDGWEYEIINYVANWQKYIQGEDKTEAQVQSLCDVLNESYFTTPAPEAEAALAALKKVEWIEADSMDGHSLGKSGFDADEASDFLTAHHETIRKLLTAAGGK